MSALTIWLTIAAALLVTVASVSVTVLRGARILAWDSIHQREIDTLRDEMATILGVINEVDGTDERQIMIAALAAIRARLAELEPDSPAWRQYTYLPSLYYCSWCRTAYRRDDGDTQGCPNGCVVTAEDLRRAGVSMRQAVEMLDRHGRQRHPSQVRHQAEPVVDLGGNRA